jgi:hypothetical protein
MQKSEVYDSLSQKRDAVVSYLNSEHSWFMAEINEYIRKFDNILVQEQQEVDNYLLHIYWWLILTFMCMKYLTQMLRWTQKE